MRSLYSGAPSPLENIRYPMPPVACANREPVAPLTVSTRSTARHRAASQRRRPDMGVTKMLDVILVALGLAFFALSIGYAYACESL